MVQWHEMSQAASSSITSITDWDIFFCFLSFEQDITDEWKQFLPYKRGPTLIFRCGHLAPRVFLLRDQSLLVQVI